MARPRLQSMMPKNCLAPSLSFFVPPPARAPATYQDNAQVIPLTASLFLDKKFILQTQTVQAAYIFKAWVDGQSHRAPETIPGLQFAIVDPPARLYSLRMLPACALMAPKHWSMGCRCHDVCAQRVAVDTVCSGKSAHIRHAPAGKQALRGCNRCLHRAGVSLGFLSRVLPRHAGSFCIDQRTRKLRNTGAAKLIVKL